MARGRGGHEQRPPLDSSSPYSFVPISQRPKRESSPRLAMTLGKAAFSRAPRGSRMSPGGRHAFLARPGRYPTFVGCP
ncbi:MAG: hypothetical protein OZSIB_2724 [Candidatus Ozemobacter sibiricus]|uniref:Uncharacterized protein n=1 Tax=Candidatus Ozemobacter sibiricus TaxID=2268124 RepID=A0A367ZS27_9BACT|nr:MAG: hypothetical protein OZSIB_2724 [Candidatus Ozemobacter sibiricus]